jgi:hypothetical protein
MLLRTSSRSSGVGRGVVAINRGAVVPSRSTVMVNVLELMAWDASRQIHALEAELEVPLLDRIGRRVRLTSQGEDLLRRSRAQPRSRVSVARLSRS